MSDPNVYNFNTIIREIIKKSLFTERQIEIILKQKKMLDVEFGVSKGAYYRQLGQARSKIESLYYTMLLLQAYDVILPESDVILGSPSCNKLLSPSSGSRVSKRIMTVPHKGKDALTSAL